MVFLYFCGVSVVWPTTLLQPANNVAVPTFWPLCLTVDDRFEGFKVTLYIIISNKR